MNQAIVKLYSDGTRAAVQARSLKQLGWSVVLSGPNDGTDLFDDDAAKSQSQSGWVVLASKTGISPA